MVPANTDKKNICQIKRSNKAGLLSIGKFRSWTFENVQVVSRRGGLISQVVSCRGGLISQVVSRRGGLISQVVSRRGGLISQVVSRRRWSYKPGGVS